MDIRKWIHEGGWKKAMKQKQYLICAIYLILVAVAEFSMTLDHPEICIMSHAIILFLLLFHSVLEWDNYPRSANFHYIHWLFRGVGI